MLIWKFSKIGIQIFRMHLKIRYHLLYLKNAGREHDGFTKKALRIAVCRNRKCEVQVCRNRKREVGLIVPELYRARMKKSRFGKILTKEITERYRCFDLGLEQDIIFKPALKKRDTIGPKTKWHDSYY